MRQAIFLQTILNPSCVCGPWFPGGSVVKNLPAKCRRLGFDPWVGKIPWGRKWQNTPIFLPRKSHGQRSLKGYSPWCHKQLDMTEQLLFLSLTYTQSEKAGLKLKILKTKIIASCPITAWQIYGETMEIVTDFIFLGSKTIADNDCSHKIKRHLLLGRKAITNLDIILKSRGITLLTKVQIVKTMVFQ